MTNHKNQMKEYLAELKRSGKINPHIHAFLLSRLDSMATASGHEQIAKGDYCFAMENGHTLMFRPEMEMHL